MKRYIVILALLLLGMGASTTRPIPLPPIVEQFELPLGYFIVGWPYAETPIVDLDMDGIERAFEWHGYDEHGFGVWSTWIAGRPPYINSLRVFRPGRGYQVVTTRAGVMWPPKRK